MNTESALSVLLPVRNAEKTLASALRSLLAQCERRWQCVLVDDGSSDGSLEIARAFARCDARFTVVSQAAAGIVPALNAGLALCRAPYVARMDADDLMHRQRLSAQLQALETSPDLCGVGCHVRLFPRAALSDGRLAYEAWLNAMATPEQVQREAFIECPLAHPGLCLRRQVFARFGYRDCGWPEDYDLLLRLLASGERLGVVPKPLLFWRDGPGRLSRTHAAYDLARFVDCKAVHLAQTFLARSTRYLLWGYGDTGKALARALARLDRRPSHIIELHPGRIGQVIAGAPVIAVSALASVPKLPLIASVAGREARTQIREALAPLGFRELTDFVVAA